MCIFFVVSDAAIRPDILSDVLDDVREKKKRKDVTGVLTKSKLPPKKKRRGESGACPTVVDPLTLSEHSCKKRRYADESLSGLSPSKAIHVFAEGVDRPSVPDPVKGSMSSISPTGRSSEASLFRSLELNPWASDFDVVDVVDSISAPSVAQGVVDRKGVSSYLEGASVVMMRHCFALAKISADLREGGNNVREFRRERNAISLKWGTAERGLRQVNTENDKLVHDIESSKKENKSLVKKISLLEARLAESSNLLSAKEVECTRLERSLAESGGLLS